jgi:histidinol-phosphate phosphatase family protein
MLAGGRGTRLRPFTDTRPKPMIEIHGQPFLGYLIEMLAEQGFERVLLLLGYLPHVIQDYVGDGRRWGVRAEYSITDVEDDTGRRVKLAKPYLDPCFMLMYCDNYWPMDIEKQWARFASSEALGMVTIYSNRDGYTKSSVRVGEDGYVTVFDRSRTTPGLQGVEISYAILTSDLVDLIPDDNVLLETTLYPLLTARRQLLAYVTDHRYYSIGCTERLPLTEAFLARRPAVIVDRDGVLNKRPPQANYVRRWNEFEWLPGAREGLGLLHRSGFRAIVVSNQAGVGRGAMTEADLESIHARMRREVEHAGGRIDAVYYCPHDWDDGCACRKPKPGMLFQAQRDWSLDLSRVPFIGDDDRDAQAAEAAGCRPLLVSDDLSFLDIVRTLINPPFQGATSGRVEASAGYRT